MSILQIPIASAIAWLLAFAFTGAGIFNAMGGAVVQAQFLRWGYPAWWILSIIVSRSGCFRAVLKQYGPILI